MLKRFFLFLIKIYQKTLSPDSGFLKYFFPNGVCRFNPTCSQYTYESIDEFGLLRGLFFGLKRVLRCNPWNKGGYDPVSKSKKHC
jgi:uncharacterized protein